MAGQVVFDVPLLRLAQAVKQAMAVKPVMGTLMVETDGERLAVINPTSGCPVRARVPFVSAVKAKRSAFQVDASALSSAVASLAAMPDSDDGARLTLTDTQFALTALGRTLSGAAGRAVPAKGESQPDMTAAVDVYSRDLRAALRHAISIARDACRPDLECVYLWSTNRVKGGELRVLASSGYKLFARGLLVDQQTKPFNVAIPIDAARVFLRMLPSNSLQIASLRMRGDVLELNTGFASAQVVNAAAAYKSIDAIADTAETITEPSDYQVKIPTATLYALCRAAIGVSPFGQKQRPIAIAVDDGAVSVESYGYGLDRTNRIPQYSERAGELIGGNPTGTGLVWLDARYLLSALRVLRKSKHTMIHFGPLEKPVVVDADDESTTALVMAMKGDR